MRYVSCHGGESRGVVSGVWRRVDVQADANVSEKHTVSILSPEDGDSTILHLKG
jgi:hypothetical protein